MTKSDSNISRVNEWIGHAHRASQLLSLNKKWTLFLGGTAQFEPGCPGMQLMSRAELEKYVPQLVGVGNAPQFIQGAEDKDAWLDALEKSQGTNPWLYEPRAFPNTLNEEGGLHGYRAAYQERIARTT